MESIHIHVISQKKNGKFGRSSTQCCWPCWEMYSFPGGSIVPVAWKIPCASTVPSSPPCTAPSHRPRDVCRSRRGTPRKKWRMWGTPCFRDPSHKCVPIVACPPKKNEQGVPGEYTKYNIIRIPLVFFVQFFAQPFFRHLEN